MQLFSFYFHFFFFGASVKIINLPIVCRKCPAVPGYHHLYFVQVRTWETRLPIHPAVLGGDGWEETASFYLPPGTRDAVGEISHWADAKVMDEARRRTQVLVVCPFVWVNIILYFKYQLITAAETGNWNWNTQVDWAKLSANIVRSEGLFP